MTREDIRKELKFPEKSFKELSNYQFSNNLFDLLDYVETLEQYALTLKDNESMAYQLLNIEPSDRNNKSICDAVLLLQEQYHKQYKDMRFVIDSLKLRCNEEYSRRYND